ncbi:uncharacterized protein [Eurosta solidaginis]|uniref:uncharacterized protein n=1 Tax=Eurosta solidaginis TaxID=178769 RepID=UPI0035308E48
MTRSGFYFSCYLLFLFTTIVVAVPTKLSERQQSPTVARSAATTTTNARVTVTPNYPIEDMQLMQPHFITLEDFESLLRRAGELFRPNNSYLVDDNVAATSTVQQKNTSLIDKTRGTTTPYRQIQTPAIQPLNFYMPLFEQENLKLDAKSKRMEHIAPPPAPTTGDDQTNYYAAKPKKLPKKFYANTKQVNLKWLNAFENEALTNSNGHLPNAVYLLHDEHSRINFDDSFFGVDMQVKIPNNQPHREEHSSSSRGTHAQEDEFLNQGEEVGEDLMASAARQMTHKVHGG